MHMNSRMPGIRNGDTSCDLLPVYSNNQVEEYMEKMLQRKPDDTSTSGSFVVDHVKVSFDLFTLFCCCCNDISTRHALHICSVSSRCCSNSRHCRQRSTDCNTKMPALPRILPGLLCFYILRRKQQGLACLIDLLAFASSRSNKVTNRNLKAKLKAFSKPQIFSTDLEYDDLRELTEYVISRCSC